MMRVSRIATFYSVSFWVVLGAPWMTARGQIGPFHIDHFKVYDVRDQDPLEDDQEAIVEVRGQFDPDFRPIRLRAITHFANPVSKAVAGAAPTPAQNPEAHLVWYRIESLTSHDPPPVRVKNQFGERELTLGPPEYLVAPAAKDADEESGIPPKLGHFLAYPVTEVEEVGKVVRLKDQFGREDSLRVLAPKLLCVPVEKRFRHETFDRVFEDEHLMVYEVATSPRRAVDQFSKEGRELRFLPCRWLCVPSVKEIVLPSPDHWKVYDVEDIPVRIALKLQGQFNEDPQETLLDALTHFANPVKKMMPGRPPEEIKEPHAHFTWYHIGGTQEGIPPEVRVTNQFGAQSLTLGPARYLLVPAEKEEPGSQFPKDLDHYKAYEVRNGQPPRGPPISLEDQFGLEQDVVVLNPRYFAVPVTKTLPSGESFPLRDKETHLTIYDIAPRPRQVKDQFAARRIDFVPCEMLCVPSTKEVVRPTGPHFLFYEVEPHPLEPAPEIQLEGRFGPALFRVSRFVYFANPASKNREGIQDRSAHFKVYLLENLDQTFQPVKVDLKDQFGTQSFRISKPVLLLSPSSKENMPRPEGLDHYLAYQVEGGRPVNTNVSLKDQFFSQNGVPVRRPAFFCIPVDKHHEEVFLRQNPDLYFTLYDLPPISVSELRNAEDQFGNFDVTTRQIKFLAVPPETIRFVER